MNEAGDGMCRKTKRGLDNMLQNRKKVKKSKMVVAVSNEDDIDFFTWEEYLKKYKAKAVPKTAFKHVPASDSKKSGFRPGMKLEAKDNLSTCNSYWVATVVMASGPLLLLRFDGYDNDRSGDFWVNSSSQLLQPIGWCAKTGNVLKPPEAIRHKEKNWARYLINNFKNAIAAPDDLFHRSSVEEDNTNLKIGAKLEVQDSENPLCYWVASIVEIFGLRLQLRFEGYQNEDGDFWEYLLSDRLHNIGWSKLLKMVLKPPKVLEKGLQWAVFRRVTEMCLPHSGRENTSKKQDSSIPMNTGFKPGMKLEAVNPENPLLICAATVRDVLNNHFFTVEIDSLAGGEMSLLKFVCHPKSKYIFPVGWCEKNNIKLTSPRGYLGNSFQWKSYLNSTNAEAVPEALFDKDLVKQKPISLSDLNQIKLGLNMEVLNQDDPSTFWVGEVVKSVGFKLYIHLQGDSSSDHTVEVHYLSESVHHLGWGFQAGLRLKPPKSLKAEWHDKRELLVQLYKLERAVRNSPLKLKKEDSPPDIHCFKERMQLEAVNPQDPSSICVASVKKIINEFYFIVQIDSLISTTKDKNIKFWCHSKSKNIFPVGWCERNKLQLTPPPGYSNKEFKWHAYMESVQTKPAPEFLFCQDASPTEFDIGFKLEAVDQTNPETISVATVTQVVGRTIWVHLDGYPSNAVEHIYDIESYDLLPVGWCSAYGHPLLTPHQKKKEPQTRRWVASLRKRSTDSRVSTTTDSSRKRQKIKSSSSSKDKELQRNGEDKNPFTPSIKEPRSVSSTVSASQQTPSSSTADDSSLQSEKKVDEVELESDIDTTSESGQKPTTTIDLIDDNNSSSPPDHIRLFVKKSCSCGPYVDKLKFCLMPDIIGPATPNTILRKVVENLVRCSYSAEKVLQLLASEKEKKSFLSIIKTIVSKLSLCENLLSLHLVQECASCDKGNPSSTTTTLPTSATKEPTPIAQDRKQQQAVKQTPPSIDATLPNSTTKQVTTNTKQQPTPTHPNSTTIQITPIGRSLRQKPLQKTPPQMDVSQANSTTKQITPNPKQQPIKKTTSPPIDATQPNSTTIQSTRKEQNPRHHFKKTPLYDHQSTSICIDDDDEDDDGDDDDEDDDDEEDDDEEEEKEEEEVTGKIPERHISKWSTTDVVEFITPRDCKRFANVFLEQEVDGKALMLLSLDDIHKVLGVTLGPAIKLHDDVQKLRRRLR